MAVIAVAGGTGNVGRTLVEAIITAGKHDVKVLARKVSPEHWTSSHWSLELFTLFSQIPILKSSWGRR